jgi:hypothetical protein
MWAFTGVTRLQKGRLNMEELDQRINQLLGGNRGPYG